MLSIPPARFWFAPRNRTGNGILLFLNTFTPAHQAPTGWRCHRYGVVGCIGLSFMPWVWFKQLGTNTGHDYTGVPSKTQKSTQVRTPRVIIEWILPWIEPSCYDWSQTPARPIPGSTTMTPVNHIPRSSRQWMRGIETYLIAHPTRREPRATERL